ncbi:Putative glucokinase [Prochlorococcus marinus str. MIT 9515]|uniref:Putative glucokinase n=1 Tax=Prochlorococcus marinus (strain MIT 9515) TaxID=167542 RepID=A2BVQ9_PROM5|nr:glucokinase [Prochlorococcus marinus]ABM71870.1 Putative glucokinase [Prochlorococcus marinus str. MIT 9515]
MNFLACDLGGTKVLVGIYEKDLESDTPKLIFKKKYLSTEWDSFDSIIENFLEKECKNITWPLHACFAIAGPVRNNAAKIINLSWNISGNDLKMKFKFESVELINDFGVLIYGIPFLQKNQFATIQNGEFHVSSSKNFHAIVGAGTGLGIARGFINGNNIEVLASEGGHVEFSPRSKEEWELKIWLKNHLKVERISCERIVSGEGLSRIAEWRLSKPDAKNHPFQKTIKELEISEESRKKIPSQICKLSNEGDILMMEIERIWLEAYASLLGDIAVHELCFGGLWIAGGTATKHFKNFKSDSFLKQISNKGRLIDIVKSIPIKIILDEEFGLYSAACRAKMLLKTT